MAVYASSDSLIKERFFKCGMIKKNVLKKIHKIVDDFRSFSNLNERNFGAMKRGGNTACHAKKIR